MGVDDDYVAEQADRVEHCERLLNRLALSLVIYQSYLRLNEIVAHVVSTSQTISPQEQSNLLVSYYQLLFFICRSVPVGALEAIIENRRFLARGQERKKEDPIDSDDEE